MSDPTTNEYRQQRLANMEELRKLGHKPFGQAFARTGRLAEVRAGFQEGGRASIAGRLMTIRNMGKSTFADLGDGTGRLQIYAGKNQLGEEAYAAFKLLDLGDFIGVEGALFTTRTGEQTLSVERWKLLSKAVLPLPEKWHGLKDVEARYRQRYLDLVANPEVRKTFDQRSAVVREARSYLHGRGFTEVETPMMQPQAGGATAKPFVTHYTVLDRTMYLRIAPELYLKRLLVGGYDKVFELNRNFRNEGLSRTHNPEFTMLEVYEAFSDVNGMKDLIQGLILHVAQTVIGKLQVGSESAPIDLTPPWRTAPYRDLIREKMGADWYDLPVAEARRKAQALGLSIEPNWDMMMVSHEVYEKLIEKSLVNPTFVTRLPYELVPLAKVCEDDPSVVDVFELVIGGQEVSPGYTELNDPIEQRKRLEAQVGEDAARVDEEFIEALEHGMPPAGGAGLGIDRLVMILTGIEAIRDVILFPQLKTRQD